MQARQAAAQLETILALADQLGSSLGPLQAAIEDNDAHVQTEMAVAQQWRSRRRELQRELQKQEAEVLRLRRQLTDAAGRSVERPSSVEEKQVVPTESLRANGT